MAKSWCVGEKLFSNTKNILENEEVNPKTKTLVVFVVVINFKFFLSK